jgi:RNA polymerase sigma-54 factor
VIVRRRGGRWVATINPDVLPRIRVNELYVDILRRSRTRANGELAQQLQEARWLVRNVQQRFQTIRRVAQAIVDRQERFFDHGDLAMKPLFRRDIARALDMHESTISRVTCDKYMATPRGLIEFAHFFGSHLVADGGYACSATAIRALIRHMIATEDAAHPLSDVKLTRKLGERGVRIGRRTVTKYRDALRIPPVEARRMAPSRSPERRCEANPTAVAD